jgi:hypothetical protein
LKWNKGQSIRFVRLGLVSKTSDSTTIRVSFNESIKGCPWESQLCGFVYRYGYSRWVGGGIPFPNLRDAIRHVFHARPDF